MFGKLSFDYDTVYRKIKELAFLNKGLEITLVDERVEENKRPIVKQFKYTGGIADFVMYLTENKERLYQKPFYLEGQTDVLKLELAIMHTDEYTDNVLSYVNNINTPEGGTHETGLKSAIKIKMQIF